MIFPPSDFHSKYKSNALPIKSKAFETFSEFW